MRVSRSLRRWLRPPSRIALLLGLGALATGGARADTGQDTPGAGVAPIAHGDQASTSGLLIRIEGGQVYLSEAGGEFRELRLGDAPEAVLLRQLLERNAASAGTTGIPLHPMILAGNGGDGFHWSPGGRSATRDKSGPAGSSTPAVGGPSARPTTPLQNSIAPVKATIGRSGEKG
jgi:hypothetical protein